MQHVGLAEPDHTPGKIHSPIGLGVGGTGTSKSGNKRCRTPTSKVLKSGFIHCKLIETMIRGRKFHLPLIKNLHPF